MSEAQSRELDEQEHRTAMLDEARARAEIARIELARMRPPVRAPAAAKPAPPAPLAPAATAKAKDPPAKAENRRALEKRARDCGQSDDQIDKLSDDELETWLDAHEDGLSDLDALLAWRADAIAATRADEPELSERDSRAVAAFNAGGAEPAAPQAAMPQAYVEPEMLVMDQPKASSVVRSTTTTRRHVHTPMPAPRARASMTAAQLDPPPELVPLALYGLPRGAR